MRLRVIGRNGKGLVDEINGRVALSPLMGNHTKQMQGYRLTGVDLQNFLVNAFSLGQLTRIVVLYGEIQGLLDG